jgi:hypothetical protein
MLDLFTKENFAIAGVIVLFIWRIIDAFIRQKKKKESELQKLAFDMAKFRFENNEKYGGINKALLSYYFYYLDALTYNFSPSNRRIDILNDYDSHISHQIDRLNKINEEIEKLDQKLYENHKIYINDIWQQSVNWRGLYHYFKRLMKSPFKKDRRFYLIR